MIINIVPKKLVKIYTIEKIDITISNLILNESVTINILLMDSDSQLVEVKNITLTGDEYNEWADNDSYIISKVCKYLDLTPL